MKMRIKSVVLCAVALAMCWAGWASAQTLKTDAEIEAMGYTHIYSLSIPNTPNFRNGASYSLDNSNLDLGPIESVAYRLNLGTDNFCYASFGAYTSNLKKIGVPTFTSQVVAQQYVYNLYYEAKSPSLTTTGTTVTKGNIEFWPWNYTADNAMNIPNASGVIKNKNTGYDFGDKCSFSGSHGCMQVHDYQNSTTVFAFNRFNDSANATLGIGNCTNASYGKDWTMNYNSASYSTKQLDVYAKPVFSEMISHYGDQYNNIKDEVSSMKLVYKLDCPLTGTYSANNYTVNNATNSDIAGMPLSRVGYYMVMEKDDGSFDYAYASYDAVTNDLTKIGLPFSGSSWYYQQKVSNMTVQSNVDGVVNGKNIATGNIEIWNTNYSQPNAIEELGASSTKNNSGYDFGDTRTTSGSGNNYACFQIHNYGAKQTIMALNRWNGQAKDGNTIDMGIGNNTPKTEGEIVAPDYTFDGNKGANSNASQYQTRSLYVLAQPAIAPCMSNVDNASDYTLVQGLRLTSQMSTNWHTFGVDYDIVNNVASLQSQGVLFDRVGYYMEYAQNAGDPLTYVFVSFDAMTTDISKIGIPVSGSGEFYQQVVNNMEVTTNVAASKGKIYEPGTTTQAAAHTTYSHSKGFIEFWPSSYTQAQGGVNSVGSDAIYDLNDYVGNPTEAGHGSMQIHSLETEQTIFALNNFKGPKQYGIGTNPSPSANNKNSQFDWTFDETKTGYAIANVYTFVHQVDVLLTTSAMSMYQRDLTNQANVTLSGTWAVTNGVTIDVVQASVDGGDWFTLTMNSDGTFTGTTSLMGGMHDVQYQALDASGTVLATKSGQVGVGEIFITAGESNATNNGSAPQYSTSSLAFSYNSRTGEWQLNEDPQQGPLDGSSRGSMWPSFTDTMAELEGVPIATYSVGYNKSTIAQWNNNTNGIYSNLQAAMDFLNENAEGFAGILWQQGESDKGTSQEEYLNKLTALIARTRTDSGNENLPWGVAIASADGNGTTYSNVTNAQQQVIDGDSYVFQGVNSDAFPSSWRVTSSNYRYLTADGLFNGGQLWATTAGESIIDLRKYWFVTSEEAVGISNWEVNGVYKLGVKLVSGANLSVEADNSIQMLGAGAVEVAENYNLTLSGEISGSGELTKTGKGTLVLSGDFSAFTGKTTVSDGTLKLAAGGTLYDLSGGTEVKSDDPESEYNPVNLVSQSDLTVNSNSGSDTKFIGKIDAAGQTVTKTGTGTLKIYSDENNFSKMDNFVVEAGRLDFKGYFEGSIDVEAGAVLSPGNSIGTLTIDGETLPENVSALILHTGSTLLMEVAGPNPDDNDKLIVDGIFTIEDGAIINITLADNYRLAPYDTFEAIIQADGTSADIIKSALTSSFFTGLDVRQNGSTYTITGILDPNAVPEPSTWALLLLGAAGLMYMRKRNK